MDILLNLKWRCDMALIVCIGLILTLAINIEILVNELKKNDARGVIMTLAFIFSLAGGAYYAWEAF